MTIERASEIVKMIHESNCSNQVAYDLFSHFLNYFHISVDDIYTTKLFAQMCGFAMITCAQTVGGENVGL